MKKKMLIVYYSVSNGNAKGIAQQLQKATDADMISIETIEPYTGTYNEIVEQGQREVNQGYTPKLQSAQKNPEDYDVIVIGTPTWWYTMAPAVLSFLKIHDWNGKMVIPFQTHGDGRDMSWRILERTAKVQNLLMKWRSSLILRVEQSW